MSRTVSVVVGVALLVVGVLGLVAWLGDSPDENEIQQFADVTEIEFDLSNAPVEFVAGGGDGVEVDYTYSTSFLRAAEVTIEQQNGVLRIRQDCPQFFAFNCRATFDVTVPPDTEISGSTSNGSLFITGVEGRVEVSTSNGPITVEDVTSNPLTVRTSNGAIRGSGIESDTVEATTSNGPVDLSFAMSPAKVTVRSSNGAIELYLPDNAPPYSVDATTSNGNVRTEIRTDPAAPETISARTSNGDVTVVYR